MRLTSLLKLVVLAVGLAGVVMLVLLLRSPFTVQTQQRLAISAFIVAGLGTVALGLAAARERGRLPRTMMLGLLLVAVAAVAWLGLLWSGAGISPRSFATVIAMLLTGWAILLMVVGVEMAQPVNAPVARWSRRVTVGLTLALVPMWSVAALGPIWEEAWLVRVMAAVVVVIMCGLLMNLILARWHALVGDPGERGRIAVRCPRCGEEQQIALGGDACGGCGLRIRVQMP
jgi:hypothetical protein